jgi:hypothetical protein
MRFVIGITGNMGVGKTTLANEIAGRLNGYVLPFAAPVKSIAKSMGWNGEKDERGRRLLQLIGTECGRECIGEDVWVRRWLASLVEDSESPSAVIADDVRFENEADAIRARGGLIVRVTRPGFDGDGHASETQRVDAHMEIANDGTVERLKAQWARVFLAATAIIVGEEIP